MLNGMPLQSVLRKATATESVERGLEKTNRVMACVCVCVCVCVW